MDPILLEPNPVPLRLYPVQPIACDVINFSQHLAGAPPDFNALRLLSDVRVVHPYDRDQTIIGIALLLEGYQTTSETEMRRFFSLSTTTHFVQFNEKGKRENFPALLDITMEPFHSAVSLAISISRGHLLTRFQGTLWPNFILPSISVQELFKALKERDTPSKRAHGSADKPTTSPEKSMEFKAESSAAQRTPPPSKEP